MFLNKIKLYLSQECILNVVRKQELVENTRYIVNAIQHTFHCRHVCMFLYMCELNISVNITQQTVDGSHIWNTVAYFVINTQTKKSLLSDPQSSPVLKQIITMTDLSINHDFTLAADSYHEVIVISCLIAGQTEILEFVINETLDENCDVNRLTIDIEPTVHTHCYGLPNAQ